MTLLNIADDVHGYSKRMFIVYYSKVGIKM